MMLGGTAAQTINQNTKHDNRPGAVHAACSVIHDTGKAPSPTFFGLPDGHFFAMGKSHSRGHRSSPVELSFRAAFASMGDLVDARSVATFYFDGCMSGFCFMSGHIFWLLGYVAFLMFVHLIVVVKTAGFAVSAMKRLVTTVGGVLVRGRIPNARYH